MNCPACKNTLSPVEAGSVKVDVCKDGCGGMWFDRFELAKVEQQSESAGESLLSIPRKQAPNTVKEQPRFSCPQCSILMMRHFSSASRKVVVDECPKCGGTWLDAGELATLRTLNETPETKAKLANAYFDEVFGRQMAMARTANTATSDPSQRIASMFRFLTPSS